MGRQTAIVATDTDERMLLDFMRSTTEIQIFVFTAKTAKELWVPAFAPFNRSHRLYYIWNRTFPWKPLIEPTRNKKGVFVGNVATASVIEFARTDIDWLFRPNNKLLVADGRLYWSKDYLDEKADYDVTAFARWYDQIMRWVRKHGQREPAISGAYLLPDACRRWQEAQARVKTPRRQPP